MTELAFNVLAICGAAGFSGVMLCIGVTLGGYWRSLPAGDFLAWFAANNRFVATSIPLMVLPTFIGLSGSLWFAWNTSTFTLWLLSTLCIVVVMILTFAYFVPTNVAFAKGSIEVGEVAGKLSQWIRIHYFRIAFGMLSAVLGVIAVAK